MLRELRVVFSGYFAESGFDEFFVGLLVFYCECVD